MSDVPGQSGHALPEQLRQICARMRHMQRSNRSLLDHPRRGGGGSRNGRYGIFAQDRADQSTLMAASLITLDHFSVYAPMNVRNSAGEPASTVPPRSAIRAFVLGSVRAALISWLSLLMISTGVFLGAPTPCQPLAS